MASLTRNDPTLQAAKHLARTSDDEPAHCFQVARIAEALFVATETIHGLGYRELRLLIAAALLHDTGYSVNPQSHHKGSRDFILRAELPGFTSDEQLAIACVARYHRGSHPKAQHKVFRDLPATAQRLVRQLAAILRIADGLDRSHDAACRQLTVERRGDTLHIRALFRGPGGTDLWGANRKKALWEDVFGIFVIIEAEEETAK